MANGSTLKEKGKSIDRSFATCGLKVISFWKLVQFWQPTRRSGHSNRRKLLEDNDPGTKKFIDKRDITDPSKKGTTAPRVLKAGRENKGT